MKNFTLIIALNFCLLSFAQNTIIGTVTDEIGPLAGATVILKNSSIGVVTDFDGRFELNALPTDTLSISYLGYHSKEILIKNKNLFNIVLDGAIELDEVIICGYESTCVVCKIICRQTCRTSCGFEVSWVKNIDDLRSFQPKLFPNPSPDGLFQLTLNESYENVELTIASITGQIVQTNSAKKVSNSLGIDLSNLPSGIYLINIIADGQRLSTKKAIKK